MKKLKFILAAAVFSMAALAASAKGGIEAGYMNMGYSVSGKGISGSNPSLNGFYVGVSDDMDLVAGLGIRLGLNYSFTTDKSAKSLVQNISMKGGNEKDHYLNVPLRLRYNFNIIPKVLKIQAYAGPVFSLGLSHTYSYDFALELGGQRLEGAVKYNYYTGKFKSDVFDQDEAQEAGLPAYKRFDMALGGGLGIELLNFLEVKVGYDWGLVNRTKAESAADISCTRDMLYLAVGFRF